MKKVILGLVILVSGFVTAQTVTLTVNTSGFKNNNGQAKIGLYNEEGKFLREVFKSVTSEIKNLKSTTQFKDIPVGTYAVSVYHDENNSGILERGMYGIPKEDNACSNNAKGNMGPPLFADAKFTITKDTVIEVTLNHLD